jgi:hypothetical protein
MVDTIMKKEQRQSTTKLASYQKQKWNFHPGCIQHGSNTRGIIQTPTIKGEHSLPLPKNTSRQDGHASTANFHLTDTVTNTPSLFVHNVTSTRFKMVNPPILVMVVSTILIPFISLTPTLRY